MTGRIQHPTLVETGLPKKVQLQEALQQKTRVTLEFTSRENYEHSAKLVDRSTPSEVGGYYWGYRVRRCRSLSAVFTECPFPGGYDLSFGTSERGSPLSEVAAAQGPDLINKHRHLLVVFGGVAGIESAVGSDPELLERGLTPATVKELFDHWINILPGQGSRTIRTEEAVWIGLMGIKGVVQQGVVTKSRTV